MCGTRVRCALWKEGRKLIFLEVVNMGKDGVPARVTRQIFRGEEEWDKCAIVSLLFLGDVLASFDWIRWRWCGGACCGLLPEDKRN